jgi:hypothetical protein
MQNDAALQLNALYGAQRAEARQRAEETRKKLVEFASAIECEMEDCVVTLGEQQEDESAQPDRKRRQNKNMDSDPEEDSAETQISDWA